MLEKGKKVPESKIKPQIPTLCSKFSKRFQPFSLMRMKVLNSKSVVQLLGLAPVELTSRWQMSRRKMLLLMIYKHLWKNKNKMHLLKFSQNLNNNSMVFHSHCLLPMKLILEF